MHFYPRSPCGERPLAIPRHQQADAFLSTLSLRRATKICKYVARRNVISIHALLAESDIYCHLSGASYSISIHALLAESDGPWSTLPIGMANFYPRSPCGERLVVDGHRVHITRFLSTLSLRRATSLVLLERLVIWYFYPRSPCGERPLYLDTVSALASFLSTLSLRRATSSSGPFQGDQLLFYPRSPCGERRYGTSLDCNRVYFSIHALLAESDSSAVRLGSYSSVLFYPRSPCGERRKPRALKSRRMVFSIHALLAESDID